MFSFFCYLYTTQLYGFHRFFCSTRIYFPVAGATTTTTKRRRRLCLCIRKRRRRVLFFCFPPVCLLKDTHKKGFINFLSHPLFFVLRRNLLRTYFLLFVVKSMLIAYRFFERHVYRNNIVYSFKNNFASCLF